MAKPPDPYGFTVDKSLSLKLPGNGPKYLVISRYAETDENKETLATVSPFLIKKVIDNVCGGEVESCKKIRNGNLLIITKTYAQASKLIQLTSLTPSIRVSVSEHTSLNCTKGVIYSNALRGIDEKEIQEELVSQNVSEIRKIKKLTNGTLTETGLLVVTFSTLTLPSDIFIGYEKINIRPFIPLPLKCRNCHRFGHSFKYCNQPALCSNCSNTAHIFKEGEICSLQQTCINCHEADCLFKMHSPMDKNCPIFIKEKEIQAISTLEKKDKKEAARIYNSRHQTQQNNSFSSVVQNTNQRTITNYSDLPSSTKTVDNHSQMTTRLTAAKALENNKKTVPITDNNVFILPRTANKKARFELKKKKKSTRYAKTTKSIN